MIILISAKDFLDKPKKLVGARNYHLINASDKDEILTFKGGSNKISGMIPGKQTLKGDNLKKGELAERVKKYLKCEDITLQVGTAVSYQLTDVDSNIYVIMDKKVINALGDKIIKRFNKLIGTEEGELVVGYNDFDTICKWYRKYVTKKYEKMSKSYEKSKDDFSYKKTNNMADELDRLDEEISCPDKLEARKTFIKKAEPTKAAIKAMKKFMDDNEALFNASSIEINS